MKLTANEEYGFRCLLQIGRRGAGGSLTIPEISRAEGISVPYVAKLLRSLRTGGLTKSVRGKAGGYSLSRPANQIVVADVLVVLGGRMFESGFCKSHAGVGSTCTHSEDCSIRTLWHAIQGALDHVLAKTTLQDLLCTEVEMNAWVDARTLTPASPPTPPGSPVLIPRA